MTSTKHLRKQEQAQIKSHRAKLILETGYRLILERGIVEVEMKDVAEIAQISRATLYRYFPSKQDLTFAIMDYVAKEQIIPKYKSERKSFTGTGYEKFAQFVGQLVNAYQLFPDFFRFTAMVVAYYSHQIDAEEASDSGIAIYMLAYIWKIPHKPFWKRDNETALFARTLTRIFIFRQS